MVMAVRVDLVAISLELQQRQTVVAEAEVADKLLAVTEEMEARAASGSIV